MSKASEWAAGARHKVNPVTGHEMVSIYEHPLEFRDERETAEVMVVNGRPLLYIKSNWTDHGEVMGVEPDAALRLAWWIIEQFLETP